ncbi:RNA polymerase sigma factor [Shewanella mangrovi]|uniref:RNA polymerase sigma factor n=1 Tax=Shewanella mangrovi TaxID=1515746 RepID=UPI00068F4E06|nr:RNA polymerase sigma factor [Shewanella mangrovi]
MTASAALTNNDDEQRLVQRARRGDTQAFEQLYKQHHQRVYALCFRIAGQVPLAEEMTQDCFIRAWEKLEQFRGDSKFSTWLHSLSVNQALTTLKKQRSFWARFLPESSGAESTAPTTELLDSMLLDKHVLQLPERARIVFVLFAIEGYSHEEIAQLMRTSAGTSKAQYHRARALLKEMLS